MSIRRRVFARHSVSLRVYLHMDGDWREGSTVDVSRKGMFVATEPLIAVGDVVRIRAEMLDGRMLNLGGTARRVVSDAVEGRPGPGLAIELTDTTMSSQAIWEHFVLRVGGARTDALSAQTLPDDEPAEGGRPPQVSRATAAAQAPAPPTERRRDGRQRHIVARPRNDTELRAIRKNLLRHGRLHLRSELTCDAGETVTVVITHPESDGEFTLEGQVGRAVVDEAGRHIGLRVVFDEFSSATAQEFTRFIDAGHAGQDKTSAVDQRIAELRQACARNPAEADAHIALAWALLMERGEVAAATAAFERACRLAPATAEVRWGLALARALVGDGKGALEMAALARRP